MPEVRNIDKEAEDILEGVPAGVLQYQSTGVLLTKWRHPVKDLPVGKQWFKLASMVVVVVTALPSCSGMSSGRISWTLPYTEYVQSKSWSGRKE